MSLPGAPPLCLRLSIERQEDAQGLVLLLRGEIDLSSIATLEHAVIDALSTRPGRIVIDLVGVEFIDSSGLRTLIVAQERAHANGQSLNLRNVGPQARRLFELTGTADAFVTG